MKIFFVKIVVSGHVLTIHWAIIHILRVSAAIGIRVLMCTLFFCVARKSICPFGRWASRFSLSLSSCFSNSNSKFKIKI